MTDNSQLGQSETSTSREDAALEAFDKAVCNALMFGYDGGLLAERIAALEQKFYGEGDDDE